MQKIIYQLTIVFILSASMLITACEKDITACFKTSSSSIYTDDYVTFSDCSEGGGFLDNSKPVEFSWDFGDGTTASGSSVSHSYSADGTYTVTQTVKDADGDASGTSSQVIIVKPATGNVTFWTGVLQPSNIVVQIGGTSSEVTWWYYTAPTCNATYCANFTLKEGSYYYYAYTVSASASGTVNVVKGQCIEVQL